VRAGEQLIDGRATRTTSERAGEKELQSYLVNEIQEVYRLQGVNINDKHIEVITRQMMRWVKIEDVGDTEFLVDDVVDRFRFLSRTSGHHGRRQPAKGARCSLASRRRRCRPTRSSRASFQETTRVLTEASISGKVDHLRGLKENVTMGRLIRQGPASSGTATCRSRPTSRRPAAAAEEDLDLERDIDYLVDVEKPTGATKWRVGSQHACAGRALLARGRRSVVGS